jgi:hypothetical protein
MTNRPPYDKPVKRRDQRTLLRGHVVAYAALGGILLVVDLLTPGLWWSFWPLLIWGVLVILHYLYVKSTRIDDDWAAERATEVAHKAYDLGHIEDIRERYRGARSAGDGDAEPEDRRTTGS